jgi:tRNA (guanine-N7-)-methyltransferase
MRLRHVKGASEKVRAYPDLLFDDVLHEKIDLTILFLKSQPLHVEIGMGKGQFLYRLAKQYPHLNFVGIEKFDSAIVKALDRLLLDPLDNLRLIRADATYIDKLFEANTLDRIYLNFSDPWPKARHEKRRLTHPNFLQKYKTLLQKNKEIHFKTDNRELFDYSVETMKQFEMGITYLTYDLHHEQTDIIMTEFEERFVSLGQPIFKLTAKFKEE